MDKSANKFQLKMIGVSHVSAPLEIREKFSIDPENYTKLYNHGRNLFRDIFIISTCNRTELYSSKASIDELTEFLLDGSEIDPSFLKYTYQKVGLAAVNHLFRVSVGLDSLVLGDHEIIGQVRKSYGMAIQLNALSPLTDRLFQFIFSTAKRIRSETSICEGSASTSFSGIKMLKARFGDLQDKRILLYGAGKIGTITCENMASHVDSKNITILNRTQERALALASKYNMNLASVEQLEEEVFKNDIIIVATNSRKYTITPDLLQGVRTEKTFLDLSVPRNVDPEIKKSEKFKVIYIDDLKEIQNDAMETRSHSLPMAEHLVKEGVVEFIEWVRIHGMSPTFKAIKKSLENIKKEEAHPYLQNVDKDQRVVIENITDKIIKRMARNMISHIKENQNKEETPLNTVEAMFKIRLNGQ